MSRNGHRGVNRARRALRLVPGRKLPDEPPTDNARMIRRLMGSRAIKGSPKNYILIVGGMMLDHAGTHSGVQSEGGNVAGEDVHLVHKRDLAKVIGEEAALRFWEPGVGRVDGASQPDPDLFAVEDEDGVESEPDGEDGTGDIEGTGEPDA